MTRSLTLWVLQELSINNMFIGGSKGNQNPEVTQVTALRTKQEDLTCGKTQEACETKQPPIMAPESHIIPFWTVSTI